jgi:hypothetical protein
VSKTDFDFADVMLVDWYQSTNGSLTMTATSPNSVERVQLGVRMEKKLVKVLKGLSEFDGITLGQLLEKIVLHSFEPVPGQEGEMSVSPHSKEALAAITGLKRVYGLDYDMHAFRQFGVDPGDAANETASVT